MHIIYSCCHAVALKQLDTLIERHPRKRILRTEVTLRTSGWVCGTIVNLMTSEIRIDRKGATGIAVMVFQSRRNNTTCNPLVGIIHGLVGCTRITGIEVCHVAIDVGIPVVTEVVAQF